MKKRARQCVQLGLYGVLLTCAACSGGGAEPPSISETVERGEMTKHTSGNELGASAIGESMTRQVSGAVADLASRLEVAVDAITVQQARHVSWGSAALGCPQEGMNYTQVIVPGLLVILESRDVLYRYHGRAEDALTYCPDTLAEEPAYGQGQEFM